jgi:hypothetical protein
MDPTTTATQAALHTTTLAPAEGIPPRIRRLAEEVGMRGALGMLGERNEGAEDTELWVERART